MSILIPGLVVAAVNALVLKYFWRHKIAWWEPLPPIVANLLICVLAKFGAETSLTTDYEFWGGWGIVAGHQEPWTEWYEVEVDDYCDKTVTENGKMVTRRVKCGSHRETRYNSHPEYWWLENSNGETISTNSQDYTWLARDFWKNETQETGHYNDYHRVRYGFHYSGEGYLYKTRWPGTDENLLPTTTQHSYTNKVQAADQSLFHFERMDEQDIKDFGLYDLPQIRGFYRMDYIQGWEGVGADRARRLIEVWNAKLGREKQVQMRILVFVDRPLEAALRQEAHWMGGNKNEFIVCVGVDSKTQGVQWSHVISWTEQELLKIKVRDFARSMRHFDPVMLVNYMVPEIRKDFIRKPFSDFNYLRVKTPTWAYWLGFFVCIAVTVGFDAWAIQNDFDEGD